MNRPSSKHAILMRFFLREMILLIQSPMFILLTLFGNLYICLMSFFFFHLESEVNPKIHGYIDALWWGFATATTTGYGDITPVTMQGKILGILLMLSGMALFAMFTAFFAETILTSARHHKD